MAGCSSSQSRRASNGAVCRPVGAILPKTRPWREKGLENVNEAEFIEVALRNEINREILKRLKSLQLNDAWLVSGALFQSAWNVMTGREPEYGIKDYDVFYFDPDLSWEAEEAAIRSGADLFADLERRIEIRNQARVHLWYEDKFHAPYPALSSSTDGIDRFLMTCAQVGLAQRDNELVVYAPSGFHDLEQMVVRPNRTRNFRSDRYNAKASKWRQLWPELRVIPA
jgi:hypothetical protein